MENAVRFAARWLLPVVGIVVGFNCVWSGLNPNALQAGLLVLFFSFFTSRYLRNRASGKEAAFFYATRVTPEDDADKKAFTDGAALLFGCLQLAFAALTARL